MKGCFIAAIGISKSYLSAVMKEIVALTNFPN